MNSKYLIYYKISRFVIATVVLEKNYPIKLANLFIDTILKSFLDEVKTQFGVDYQSKLETIDSNHHFIKFDRVIKAKRK